MILFPSHAPRIWAYAGATGLALLAASVAQALPTAPPIAPIRNVTDNYFGRQVTDPYRWMENLADPEVVSWFRGQADYTNAELATLPGRDKLLSRISQLSSAGTIVWSVQHIGNRYFYQKQISSQETGALYVRDGLSGAERLLVDPNTKPKNGVHYAIDYYEPSMNGRYVVCGLSAGGSEQSTLYVYDANTGKQLTEAIDRTQNGNPSWRPDNHSFFYNRLPKLAAGRPTSEKYERSRVYLHILGSDPDADTPIFGYGLSPRTNATFIPSDFAFVVVSPASSWAIGLDDHGVQNEVTLFAAPLAKVNGPATPWVKIADVADDVTAFDLRGSTIYLLTHKNASHYKVIATNIGHPDLAASKVIIPPGEAVIQNLAVAKDALYTVNLDGGIGRLRKVGFNGGSVQQVKLPFDGAIGEFYCNPLQPGTLMKLTSWTKPQLFYQYDPVTGSVMDTKLRAKSPVDYSVITSVEVKARASDGTLIPLSIIYPKDAKLDGTHPLILEGYGAYGLTLSPGFNPTLLAWLERGGIFAVAHVRGGGEYGEDWHLAGEKLTKPNTWNDLIACAQYLIAKGYTSTPDLAIEGGSAGGITVGRAMTERPDLFGVVLDDVGVSNPLRQELATNGPDNIPEFGTFTQPEGFKALYEMDAYHHVQNGVKYPAVMLTTGINDPRVSPWEPAKMTARLQAATSSGKPVLLRVDYDAGHGIGSSRSQSNQEQADEWSFTLWQMGDPDFQPTMR